MVAFPVAPGVTQVDATPLSSLIAEQLEAPLQIESAAPFVVDHPTVAPFTGVMPSAATTRTLIGLAACVPTGVGGFAPCNRTILSLAAAPKVRAFVMIENAPLTGSFTVMVCGPALCAEVAARISPVLIASRASLVLPTEIVSPGANPVPCKV